METTNKNQTQENWLWWQWLVIIILLISIIISLYFYISPINKYTNQLDKTSFNIDKEIEGYKKQLGNTNNYLVYNRLASAYIRKARLSGDVSWYILAEQNAKLSLIQSPINNYSSLIALASINMARHDFDKAISLSKQTLDDPNYTLDSLGIIFDAYNSMGDINNAKKTLSEIEKSKAEILGYKLKNVPLNSVPDPVNKIRYAQINYLEGKIDQANQNYLNAMKDTSILAPEPKAWSYSMYSDFLIKTGKLEEAKEYIRYSLNQVNDYKSALISKSEIYRMEKNWQGVIDTLRAQNELNPHSDLMLRLAEAQRNLNNTTEYNKYLEQIESLLSQELKEGNFGHRRDYIKYLLEKNTDDSKTKALGIAKEEIKLRKDLETLVVVSEALLKNNKYDDIKKSFKNLIDIGLKDPRVFYLLGKSESETGNKIKAESLYKQAININPKFDPDYIQDINNFLKR